MDTWLAAVPSLLVTAILIFAPGLALLAAVRVRGFALAALSPVVTVALIGVAAVLLGISGVRWTPAAFAVVAVIAVAVAWLIGRVLTTAVPAPPQIVRRWPLLSAALVMGGGLTAFRLMAYIQSPDSISQSNDAVFHLNAVRFILETGSASSLDVSGVIGANSFYPAAWHGVTSLVVALTGVDVPTAANLVTIVIGAVIWPLGIAWFTRVVTGSTAAASFAAVIAGALQTFPVLMFQWGVLYPNALSIAMIPAAIALVISIPQWVAEGRWASGWRAIVMSILLGGVVVAAIALAQPAALLAFGLLVVVWWTVRVLSDAALRRRALALVSVPAAWIVLAGIWLAFSQSTSGSHWGPLGGYPEAIGDVLLNSQVTLPPAWSMSIAAIAGIVVASLVPRLRWLVVAWAGLSVLYILVAAAGRDIVREVLMAPWYADPSRIAAYAPLIVVPLAAIGLWGISRVLLRVISPRGEPSVKARVLASTGGAVLAVATATLALVVTPVATPTFLEDNNVSESTYASDEKSYLDPDERELLERLDELIPADASVIGNPSTGTGFGYMLSGRDVYPRTWAPPISDDWVVLAENLRDLQNDPRVCPALAAYGEPSYVLDFGEGDTTPGRWLMPGMTDFTGQPGFELVDAVGDVSLWRITGCGLAGS